MAGCGPSCHQAWSCFAAGFSWICGSGTSQTRSDASQEERRWKAAGSAVGMTCYLASPTQHWRKSRQSRWQSSSKNSFKYQCDCLQCGLGMQSVSPSWTFSGMLLWKHFWVSTVQHRPWPTIWVKQGVDVLLNVVVSPCRTSSYSKQWIVLCTAPKNEKQTCIFPSC